MDLLALCETEMRLKVVLHAAQRAQAHAEQVHPAGGLRRRLLARFRWMTVRHDMRSSSQAWRADDTLKMDEEDID
jgi:hypothetical protein